MELRRRIDFALANEGVISIGGGSLTGWLHTGIWQMGKFVYALARFLSRWFPVLDVVLLPIASFVGNLAPMLSRGKRRGKYNLDDGVSAMKTLVTGGCGFIGSHLVERLVAEGHDVRVLDYLSTGRVANIEALVALGAVELIQGRVQDPRVAAEAVDGRTHVFHLAALADIVPSIVSPMAYFDTNVNGTAVMVEAARQAGVDKFLYAVSSTCYGIPAGYPTNS